MLEGMQDHGDHQNAEQKPEIIHPAPPFGALSV
jgi:hypothetical protein